MTVKVIDSDGQEYEFRGEIAPPKRGQYMLSTESGGSVVKVQIGYIHDWHPILHPIPKYHDLGSIRFQETGPARRINPGEWALGADGHLWHFWDWAKQPTDCTYIPLEPVAILPKDQEDTNG